MLKLNESEKQFKGYICKNKLKGRVTKLNTTRKRIKREKKRKKEISKHIECKGKKKII